MLKAISLMFSPAICPIGKKKTVYVSTVFRNTFAKQTDAISFKTNINNLPPLFRNRYIVNVSDEYSGVEQIDIEFTIHELPIDVEYAFLYTFSIGLDITPIAYSKIIENKIIFKNIGKRGIYLIGYIKDNSIVLISDPMDTPPNSDVPAIIVPDKTQTEKITLFRKFMPKYTMRLFAKDMIGAKIQGANNINFEEASTLLTIDSVINYFQVFEIDQTEPFRYYRYMASDSGDIRIAEIDFIIDNKARSNAYSSTNIFGNNADSTSDDDFILMHAFDNNISTNFNAPKGSWIAWDAGKEVNLKAFKLLPRNNLNIIEPGDTYQLLYFDKGWRNLETKVASNYYIDFINVPKNSILLLRNKTKGSEERIFTYKNGQVWR